MDSVQVISICRLRVCVRACVDDAAAAAADVMLTVFTH